MPLPSAHLTEAVEPCGAPKCRLASPAPLVVVVVRGLDPSALGAHTILPTVGGLAPPSAVPVLECPRGYWPTRSLRMFPGARRPVS